MQEPWAAALIDISLVALFGLQHSVMARPWFKRTVVGRMPPAFERSTYVHMAKSRAVCPDRLLATDPHSRSGIQAKG